MSDPQPDRNTDPSTGGGEKGLAQAARGGEVERAGRGSGSAPAVRRSLLPAPGQGFGVTFAQIFRKVTTEEYPEVPKVTKPRYHGRHVLNRHPDGLEKCVGCELCAWACPADDIYVEGGDNTEAESYSAGERDRAQDPEDDGLAGAQRDAGVGGRGEHAHGCSPRWLAAR